MKFQRNKQRKSILHSLIRTCCLTGALFAYGACGYAALSNDFTPSGGQWIKCGEGSLIGKDGILNVVQQQQNAVIQWGDFSIGANATVNFSKEQGGSFNILNYVDSGNVSQITPNDSFKNIAYNAYEQGFEIKHEGNVYNVYLKGVEGKADVLVGSLSTLSSDADAAHSLEDYLRANELLNTGKGKDTGSYQLFSTQQISSSSENHNNLGYDIIGFDNLFEIKKATIDVFLNEISRTYGDIAIKEGAYRHAYSTNVNNAMKNELQSLIVSHRQDGALTGKDNGRVTQDAGSDYKWSETITMGIDLAKNYQFNDDSATSVDRVGKSIVNKAQLTISLDDVVGDYGGSNRVDYGIDNVQGIVNGDKYGKNSFNVGNIHDNALVTKDKTNNVGEYTWQGDVTSNIEALNKNYKIVEVKSGKSIITKARLTIKADNVYMQLGDRPKYTGSISGIVNGDTESSLGIGGFGISDKALEAIVGTHNGKIGIRIGNTFYYLSKMPNEDTLLNYDIDLHTGALKVSEPIIPPVESPVDPPIIVPPIEQEQPNISDKVFWETEDKYAWGKKSVKSERKAEIYYADGGMKI